MAIKYEKYQHVTVRDPNSPFYHWMGTVEQVDDNLYTVKCSFEGWGSTVLWLTFTAEQLRES